MSLFQKSTKRKSTRVARTRNGGEWTEAQFRNFIRGALRGAMWPPKFRSVEQSLVGYGINPKTKRRCKMYRCASCGQAFPLKQVKADHIVPVTGPEGFVDWNTFIDRLFVEVAGFQTLCEGCHDKKTKSENEERRALKQQPQNE